MLSHNLKNLGLILFLALFGLFALTVEAAEPLSTDAPILFTADELSNDEQKGIVTASGHVEVAHEGRLLIADKIIFNQNTDILQATGNISLLEPSGDVIFANTMEISGDFKDGVLSDIRLLLSDRSRIAANGAKRTGGNITEFRKAVYSPCELCRDEPEKAPLWQLKAVKVVHDKTRKTIEYSDAWLELSGIPVFYTPYLSHPDPTVKRKSGFLAPSFGGSSDLGFVFRTPYFINLSPHNDLTITPVITTDEGIAMAGEYRQLLRQGELNIDGSITRDSQSDIRGHIKSEGRFNVDDTWRWGFDGNGTLDDTYMRRYGFGSDSTLASRLFTEGFRKRNYMAANSYYFQGLKESDDPGEAPIVLPLFDYNHVGEPGRLGGRPSLDVNFLALTRTEGTDTRRFSVKGGWKLPYTSPRGDIYTLTTSLQGDLYHTNSLQRDGIQGTHSGVSGRLQPQIGMEWRYPFVREEGSNVYQLVEPIVSAIVSPYGGNSTKIPNEDSQDFEFDDTNLFSENRFPGLDRVEGGPRLNYGLKWGVFGAKGGNTTLFVGQSFRYKSDDTYAQGSGLEDNISDIVGKLHITPGNHFDLLYRTRLDKDNLAANRNEVQISAGEELLRLSTNYVFFERQEGSEFAGREELSMSLSSQMTRFWKGRVSGVRDLTGQGAQRSLGFNLTYEDECLTFSTDLTRSYYEDRDLKPTDAIMFRVTFKTLGEVKSGISQFQ